MSGCETSRTRLRSRPRLVRHTTDDQTAAHRRLDRRRDDLWRADFVNVSKDRRLIIVLSTLRSAYLAAQASNFQRLMTSFHGK